MAWSLRIARIAGTEVRIHFTFFLLLAFFGYSWYQKGGTPAAIFGILFTLALFGCVLLHEFGHAFAAKIYGIRTPDITLLPIGGVARLERMPKKPTQELVVALAGPAVNLVIAGILAVAQGRIPDIKLDPVFGPSVSMVTLLMYVNVWMLLFNLIPAFPMDGGRVLRALLAIRMNHAKATSIAAAVGKVIAILFAFYGFLAPSYLLILIAFFIYFVASEEADHAQFQDASHGLTASSAMMTEFRTLGRNDSLASAVDVLLAGSQEDFPVVDDGGDVVGLLTRGNMIEGLKKFGEERVIGDVMVQDVPRLHADLDLEEAFAQMQEAGVPAAPVFAPLGKLSGVLTKENVAEVVMVHKALRDRPGK